MDMKTRFTITDFSRSVLLSTLLLPLHSSLHSSPTSLLSAPRSPGSLNFLGVATVQLNVSLPFGSSEHVVCDLAAFTMVEGVSMIAGSTISLDAEKAVVTKTTMGAASLTTNTYEGDERRSGGGGGGGVERGTREKT